MSAPVYGEIHEDGKNILVRVAGNDWDMSDAAGLLNSLTAKCSAIPTGEKRNGKDVMLPDRLLVPLTYANVTQLAATFPANREYGPQLHWTPGPNLMNWVVTEVVRRSCQGDFTGTQPKELVPMPHQLAGAVAAGMNGRFLLADEMGTGKLLCSLMSLAEMEARNRKPWPCAAVVPASIIDTWLEEIAKCYPQWHAVAYRGPNRGRYLRTDGIDIFVMSYEAMRNDVGDVKNPGPLLRKKFGSVVADETHKICNYESKQSTCLRRLIKHTPNFIAATGTPITKNAGSFWPILNGMDPGSYPDRERYKSRYCVPKGHAMYGDTEVGGLNPVMEPEFRIVMQGTWRRVATADVVKDLPPKTYQTRWIDIPAKYRPAYDQMEEDMLAELPDNDTPLSAQSTLAKMMRLSQLAHSACDVRVWHEIDMDETSKYYGQEVERTEVTPKLPCWKGDALLELLGELHQDELTIDDKGVRHGQHTVGSHPVIAFAPLKQLVLLSCSMAEKAGYKVGYITGGISDSARTATRHAFQNHELDLLGVTTGAGGVGLTLTAATTVAFLMRPWSYVEASQAEARAHRKGQTEHVQIVDFVAKRTIESRIRAALRDKAKNLSELVEDRRLVEEFLGGHQRSKEQAD